MNCRIRNAKHETQEALAHFRAMTDKRSWCSVDGKGANFFREALFAGQHEITAT